MWFENEGKQGKEGVEVKISMIFIGLEGSYPFF